MTALDELDRALGVGWRRRRGGRPRQQRRAIGRRMTWPGVLGHLILPAPSRDRGLGHLIWWLCLGMALLLLGLIGMWINDAVSSIAMP